MECLDIGQYYSSSNVAKLKATGGLSTALGHAAQQPSLSKPGYNKKDGFFPWHMVNETVHHNSWLRATDGDEPASDCPSGFKAEPLISWNVLIMELL